MIPSATDLRLRRAELSHAHRRRERPLYQDPASDYGHPAAGAISDKCLNLRHAPKSLCSILVLVLSIAFSFRHD